MVPTAGKKLKTFLEGLPKRYLTTYSATDVLAHVADLNGFAEGIRTLLKDDGVEDDKVNLCLHDLFVAAQRPRVFRHDDPWARLRRGRGRYGEDECEGKQEQCECDSFHVGRPCCLLFRRPPSPGQEIFVRAHDGEPRRARCLSISRKA